VASARCRGLCPFRNHRCGSRPSEWIEAAVAAWCGSPPARGRAGACVCWWPCLASAVVRSRLRQRCRGWVSLGRGLWDQAHARPFPAPVSAWCERCAPRAGTVAVVQPHLWRASARRRRGFRASARWRASAVGRSGPSGRALPPAAAMPRVGVPRTGTVGSGPRPSIPGSGVGLVRALRSSGRHRCRGSAAPVAGFGSPPARLALRRTFSPAAAMLRVGYFRRGLRVTARARRRLPSPSQLSGGTGATRVLRLGLRTLLAHATDVGLSPCWTTHVGVGQGGEGGSRRDDGSTNR